MTFIPGMSAVCDMGGEFYPPVDDITATLYTTESSVIAWPADRLAGDVAILCQNSLNIDPSSLDMPNEVVPTGFTRLAGETDFFTTGLGIFAHREVCAYKILTGAETGNISGMNGDEDFKQLLIIRAAGTIIRRVDHTVWSDDWGPDVPAQLIDSTLGEYPKIAVGFMAGWQGRNFSMGPEFNTVSTLSEDVGGDPWRCRLGYSVFNPGDTLISYNVDLNGRGILCSGLMWFS